MPSPMEYAAVRQVLDAYLDGSYTADTGLRKSQFHAAAAMCGYLEFAARSYGYE